MTADQPRGSAALMWVESRCPRCGCPMYDHLQGREFCFQCSRERQ